MPERRDLYLTTVYPDHSQKLIAKDLTKAEALKTIVDFLDEHNFKCYYIRSWEKPESVRLRYDVGSHTEFFDWMKPTEGLKGEKNE